MKSKRKVVRRKTNSALSMNAAFEGPIPELETILHAATCELFDEQLAPATATLVNALSLSSPSAGSELQALDNQMHHLAELAQKKDARAYTSLLLLVTAGIRAISRTTFANRSTATLFMKSTHSWPMLLQTSDARNREQIAKLRKLGFNLEDGSKVCKILDERDVLAVVIHDFIIQVRRCDLECSNKSVKQALLSLPKYKSSKAVNKVWSDLAGRLVKSNNFELVRRYFANVKTVQNASNQRRDWVRLFKRRFTIHAKMMQKHRPKTARTLSTSFNRRPRKAVVVNKPGAPRTPSRSLP